MMQMRMVLRYGNYPELMTLEMLAGLLPLQQLLELILGIMLLQLLIKKLVQLLAASNPFAGSFSACPGNTLFSWGCGFCYFE
jgi:hypothetical protein